jgi:hypothetical protein
MWQAQACDLHGARSGQIEPDLARSSQIRLDPSFYLSFFLNHFGTIFLDFCVSHSVLYIPFKGPPYIPFKGPPYIPWNQGWNAEPFQPWL